jgi:BTB/POZ domain
MKRTQGGEEIRSINKFMHRNQWNSEHCPDSQVFISQSTLAENVFSYFPEGEIILQAKIYRFNSSIDYKKVKYQDTSLSLDFEEFYNTMENSDVIIITKDDKKLKAHSLILRARARSNVINDFLSTSEAQMPMILLVKFDSVVVGEFLKFLYSIAIKWTTFTVKDLISIVLLKNIVSRIYKKFVCIIFTSG